jgi:hypothetical protein
LAKFLGYAIPLVFLLYVLYINYLPFGYHKTLTIDVGSKTDTDISKFYLKPSRDLSERKITSTGVTYRELNGMTTVFLKPDITMKNGEIDIEVVGENIGIIPPYINFNPSSTQWDKSWDFGKGIPDDLINIKNKAFYFDNGAFFDGTANLELANSKDVFENEPFSVYIEWMPTNDGNDGQQIIGHTNWELWQNKDNVSFQVGRMDNSKGAIHISRFPITNDFFNKRHSALIIYIPSDTNGYTKLFIDGTSVDLTYLGSEKIWKDYGGNNNLSMGHTQHNNGRNPYFSGYIYKAYIVNKNVLTFQSKITFKPKTTDPLDIIILSPKPSVLTQIKLDATDKN